MSHRDNFDSFRGPVVTNPFEGIDPGATFNIEQGVFVPNDPPGVYPIYNMAHYDGMLLSVHFSTDKWSTVEGSAVMVGPGIAIAAAHVIEPLIAEIMGSKVRVGCIGLTPSGPRLWAVRHVTKIHENDLMILCLEYNSPIPDDGRFVQSIITTRLPLLGEPIMISGFRASDKNVPWDDQKAFSVDDGHLKYGADLLIGVGEVTQHHLTGRGSALPGPLIEVACSTPGGLSGGPAFDKNGKLVGILSWSNDDPDGRGPSQVSLLWPALVAKITPAFLPNLFPQPLSLLEMDRNLCGIDRPDVIQVSVEAGRDQQRLQVTHWNE